ncbi:MAG: VWA domain-containing protein [Solirubrobacterales bacterium]
MQIDTKLDFNLISLEQAETIHAMLELTAPDLPGERRRDPATLQVVLDRSGSMAGGALHSSLVAIDSLLGRLLPDDHFGLVVFDDEVAVAVPAGELGDPASARALLRRIGPGGMTNLSGGLLRGIQEAQRVAGEGGATVVLLSDGHANQGVTDHAGLAEFAAGAYRGGIATSTIGIGRGYDEDLMEAIARGGQGNSSFGEDGDEAGAQLASEVEGLLEQSVQAASLTVRPAAPVSAVRLYNDLPTSPLDGGFVAELGGLYGEETRRLVLEIDVPGIAALGPARVCELELRWVEVEAMEQKVARIPVNVNVVPGDQAAGRVPDAEVSTEVAYQRAQRSKKEASEEIRRGDILAAQHCYDAARADLASARRRAPRRLHDDLDQEIEMLARLSEESARDRFAARKRSISDYHLKARRRGRRY